VKLVRLATALLPLAITPLLLFGIAEGYLNLGGGEKDLLLLLPWTLWSLVFAVAALTLWARGWPHRRAVTRSAIVGLLVIAAAFAVLLVMSGAGIAGR
jgi:hypothetical protein